MRRFAYFLLFLAICLSPPARAGGLALVLSEDSGAYGEFSAALVESLNGTSWTIVSSSLGDAAPPPGAATDLVVTVGSEALRRTLARGETSPIIATLLPRQSYERLIAEFRRPERITAIYLDQPPVRQAVFLRHLLPGVKRFGMLFSPESRQYAAPFRQAWGNAGLTLDSEDADTGTALLPALNALLPRVGALVALPDSSIYRRSNIKPILISAYRFQRPVIGYSTAFVKAGALAALYTTPRQIAQQTADAIVSGSDNLPPPSPPSQYSLAINHTVAQALNIALPDEASLRRAMSADRDLR